MSAYELYAIVAKIAKKEMGMAGSKLEIHRAEFVSFYDDFVEFNDYCSFLCDAMASLYCGLVG